MKLGDWARLNGIHPETAYRWWRAGTLPVHAERVGPRTIMVMDAPVAKKEGLVAIYARVSSHDQREDLERQVGRLTSWAAAAGMSVSRVESEVGSGLNGSRNKIRKLLSDPDVTTIIVEHRDRLGRMNTELVESALAAHGRSIIVVDDGEVEDDLVQDMIDVMTSFCARLYGRRSARNRAKRAIEAATH